MNDSKLNLICNWRAILGDEVIQGEHQMRAISVRPKSNFSTCPIHATAEYPSAISHDFSKGPAVSFRFVAYLFSEIFFSILTVNSIMTW